MSDSLIAKTKYENLNHIHTCIYKQFLYYYIPNSIVAKEILKSHVS